MLIGAWYCDSSYNEPSTKDKIGHGTRTASIATEKDCVEKSKDPHHDTCQYYKWI